MTFEGKFEQFIHKNLICLFFLAIGNHCKYLFSSCITAFIEFIFVADANMQHQKQFNSKEDSNGEAKCEKMLFEHRNTEER